MLNGYPRTAELSTVDTGIHTPPRSEARLGFSWWFAVIFASLGVFGFVRACGGGFFRGISGTVELEDLYFAGDGMVVEVSNDLGL